VFVEPDLVIGSAQYKQDSDWLVICLGVFRRLTSRSAFIPQFVIGSSQNKHDSDWLVKCLGGVGWRDCVIYPHIVIGSA
jgi:hypothetical protein